MGRGLRISNVAFLGTLNQSGIFEDFQSYADVEDFGSGVLNLGSGFSGPGEGWTGTPIISTLNFALEDFQGYSTGTPTLNGGTDWATDGIIV